MIEQIDDMCFWFVDISNGEYIPQPNEVCSRLCHTQHSGDYHNNFASGYGGHDGANAAYSSSSRIFSNPPGRIWTNIVFL